MTASRVAGYVGHMRQAASDACGFVEGLPMGVQLIGPPFSEGRLLNAVHRYQLATDWHDRSAPGYA